MLIMELNRIKTHIIKLALFYWTYKHMIESLSFKQLASYDYREYCGMIGQGVLMPHGCKLLYAGRGKFILLGYAHNGQDIKQDKAFIIGLCKTLISDFISLQAR